MHGGDQTQLLYGQASELMIRHRNWLSGTRTAELMIRPSSVAYGQASELMIRHRNWLSGTRTDYQTQELVIRHQKWLWWLDPGTGKQAWEQIRHRTDDQTQKTMIYQETGNKARELMIRPRCLWSGIKTVDQALVLMVRRGNRWSDPGQMIRPVNVNETQKLFSVRK